MRLLHYHDGELLLTDDLRTDIPPYAILSHRWGTKSDEVTFTDIVNGIGRDKIGFAKIEFCGRQARRDGLTYFWVDTCCIDKSSPEELSRSIASMYNWYATADQCYVYLSDVTDAPTEEAAEDGRWKREFRRSQWFTRGWTLQELLAPTRVSFFSGEGEALGERQALSEVICEITGIDKEALEGRALDDFSEEQRFIWARDRHTFEPEDQAYCLLGIFGVTMVPHYGEGEESAWDRLKEEIIRKHRNKIIKLDVKQYTTTTPRPGSSKPLPNMKSANLSPIISMSAKTSLGQNLGVIDELGPMALRVRRNAIMSRLSFEEMDSRRMMIKSALTSTCDWILTHSIFQAWVSPKCESNSFLWIKGHAGAGKSTLMKFLDYRLAEKYTSSGEVVVSFYFNARGASLEKSVQGMYRSLIVQLMGSVEGLDEVLDHVRFGRTKLPDPEVFKSPPIAMLQEIFSALVSKLGNRQVYCLVDALDETNEEEVLDMVYFLQSLRSGSRLLVCFSSRHYPSLDLPTGLQIAIDHEIGHNEDITNYLLTNLRLNGVSSLDQVVAISIERAHGAFMWIVLVVQILNLECRHGTELTVLERLQRLPERLNTLFDEILGAGDVTEKQRTLQSLLVIMSAARPLSLEEFFFAMQDVGSNDSNFKLDIPPPPWSSMERYLITTSKGFAELTFQSVADFTVETARTKKLTASKDRVKTKEQPTSPTVQLIHESVREYLSNSSSIFKGNAGRSIDLEGHITMETICTKHIIEPQMRGFLFNEISRDELAMAMKSYPFLKYSIEYVLYHADQAVGLVPEEDSLFFSKFPYQRWRLMARVTERFTCLWTKTLIGTSIECGYIHLVNYMVFRDSRIANIREDNGKTMLMIAAATSTKEIVQLLLAANANPFLVDDSHHLAINYGSDSEIKLLLKETMNLFYEHRTA